MIIYYSGIRNRHHLSNDRKEHDTLNNIDHLLTIHFRIELRAWLQQHSNDMPYCWVIVSITPVPNILLYLDVVEECLCFGWIDGVKKKISDTQLAQRLSPRSPKSSWTELNKERVRRLERLGLMTEEGRKVLPDMNEEHFIIHPHILQALQEDPEVYAHFLAFSALYQRVRIDTIQSTYHQPEIFHKRLQKLITNTKVNKMYGQWHDNGRLLDTSDI
jgi:uncharacterized protein YdeI (YjbR/CyaY-like superfamily)